MASDREAKIRLRAHELWEEQGKPGGRETEFWLRQSGKSRATRTGPQRKQTAA